MESRDKAIERLVMDRRIFAEAFGRDANPARVLKHLSDRLDRIEKALDLKPLSPPPPNPTDTPP